MNQIIRRTTVLLLLLLGAGGAQAQNAGGPEPTFVANYRDWTLFTYEDGNGRVCYIASEPVKKEGNYTRRGPAAVLVAHFPMEPPNVQVSVQSGYPFKKKSDVEVKIGDKTYSLFTDGDNAFTRTPADDERLIAAMKRGTRMTVRGTSRKGTWSRDTYSLLGFTAAYKAMLDACGNS